MKYIRDSRTSALLLNSCEELQAFRKSTQQAEQVRVLQERIAKLTEDLETVKTVLKANDLWQ